MKLANYLRKLSFLSIRMAQFCEGPGSGAGKGGGGGGAIRSAGGAFGKMEAAKEDQYFYNKQKEQLHELKTHMSDEISFHKEQIKRHQEALDKAKIKLDDLDQK